MKTYKDELYDLATYKNFAKKQAEYDLSKIKDSVVTLIVEYLCNMGLTVGNPSPKYLKISWGE